MNHVLHVSAASAKETDDGVVETITLTAVSINPAEMIPLVGEQVVLTTPGRAGRTFGGSLVLLQLKDGKHGPEITVKVVGATELNALVGTNVTVEAAQMELPTGPGDTYGEASIKPVLAKIRDEAARTMKEERAAQEKVILEGDGKPDNPYSGVVPAVTRTMKALGDYTHPTPTNPPTPDDDLENF